MSTLVADSRYQVLESGVRLVRLEHGPAGLGWLREYRPILRAAAADFLKRGKLEGDRDVVVDELAEILSVGGSVWLVVDAEYRLLGFGAMRLRRAAWARHLVADVPCLYLYPKRTPRCVFRVLIAAMIAWARTEGAEEIFFTSRRGLRGLEAITGATSIGCVYAFPIPKG
jgi:GNAT superfamily N-acetyltransferase